MLPSLAELGVDLFAPSNESRPNASTRAGGVYVGPDDEVAVWFDDAGNLLHRRENGSIAALAANDQLEMWGVLTHSDRFACVSADFTGYAWVFDRTTERQLEMPAGYGSAQYVRVAGSDLFALYENEELPVNDPIDEDPVMLVSFALPAFEPRWTRRVFDRVGRAWVRACGRHVHAYGEFIRASDGALTTTASGAAIAVHSSGWALCARRTAGFELWNEKLDRVTAHFADEPAIDALALGTNHALVITASRATLLQIEPPRVVAANELLPIEAPLALSQCENWNAQKQSGRWSVVATHSKPFTLGPLEEERAFRPLPVESKAARTDDRAYLRAAERVEAEHPRSPPPNVDNERARALAAIYDEEPTLEAAYERWTAQGLVPSTFDPRSLTMIYAFNGWATSRSTMSRAAAVTLAHDAETVLEVLALLREANARMLALGLDEAGVEWTWETYSSGIRLRFERWLRDALSYVSPPRPPGTNSLQDLFHTCALWDLAVDLDLDWPPSSHARIRRTPVRAYRSPVEPLLAIHRLGVTVNRDGPWLVSLTRLVERDHGEWVRDVASTRPDTAAFFEQLLARMSDTEPVAK